jgi:hypothetical protein
VSTMDNGDKTTASYVGTMQMNKDGSGTFKGTWKFVSGTGKFKGLKGSGTYTGTAAADGSASGDIEGEYTLPAPAATGSLHPSRASTKRMSSASAAALATRRSSLPTEPLPPSRRTTNGSRTPSVSRRRSVSG